MKVKLYGSTLMIMVLLVGAFVMVTAQDADALFVVVLDDPGTVAVDVIIADGSPINTPTLMGPSTLADPDGLLNGWIAYTGPAGPNWFPNVTSGLSKPILGGPTVAKMDLVSQDTTSVGAGSLDVWLTDTDFSLPLSPIPYILTSTIGGTTNGTVSYKQYVDLNNKEFGNWIPPTGLTPAGIVAISGGPFPAPGFWETKSTSFALTNPFSLTEYVTITHTASGQVTSFNIESTVAAVPEPTTLLLLGFGLVGMAAYGWRRKKKQS